VYECGYIGWYLTTINNDTVKESFDYLIDSILKQMMVKYNGLNDNNLMIRKKYKKYNLLQKNIEKSIDSDDNDDETNTEFLDSQYDFDSNLFVSI
jgi:hypothetical protein